MLQQIVEDYGGTIKTTKFVTILNRAMEIQPRKKSLLKQPAERVLKNRKYN